MSRIFIVLLMYLLSSSISYSQTHYYRLAKKVVNGNVSTNVSGGQFITFIADICFESNKKGIGVGHGTLERNKKFSNSQFRVYMGKSYWGSDATFKFTSDLATLNVVTESGDVYLYKRATAPANATTCSLIRKPSSSSSDSGSGYAPSNSVQPTYTVGGYTTGSGHNNSGSGSITGNSRTERKWRNCSHCHGKGTVVRNSYTSTYGNDRQVYCAQCGRSYWASSGHSHVSCPICHGNRGFWSE